MAMISFLVYWRSNRVAMTHSLTFWSSLANVLEEALLVKSSLESCWVMVLAPPLVPK